MNGYGALWQIRLSIISNGNFIYCHVIGVVCFAIYFIHIPTNEFSIVHEWEFEVLFVVVCYIKPIISSYVRESVYG